jgi:hypothetical protein
MGQGGQIRRHQARVIELPSASGMTLIDVACWAFCDMA